MKFYFGLFLTVFTFSFSSWSLNEAESVKMTTVGIIDQANKADFEKNILTVLNAEIQSCNKCKIMNLTPYDEKGDFDRSQMLAVLSKLEPMQILLFNWNEKISAENLPWTEVLKNKLSQGMIIIAPAGQPRDNESSAPLSKTLMGQIPGAVIIGELGERDRLIGSSFFGPEMLTALRPKKEHIGKGIAPLLFTAALSRNYTKREDWKGFFALKKTKSRKIWLEMGDFF